MSIVDYTPAGPGSQAEKGDKRTSFQRNNNCAPGRGMVLFISGKLSESMSRGVKKKMHHGSLAALGSAPNAVMRADQGSCGITSNSRIHPALYKFFTDQLHGVHEIPEKISK